MIKKLHNDLFPGDDIDFLNENSDNVTFSKDEMGILSVVLNNTNLDGVNFTIPPYHILLKCARHDETLLLQLQTIIFYLNHGRIVSYYRVL